MSKWPRAVTHCVTIFGCALALAACSGGGVSTATGGSGGRASQGGGGNGSAGTGAAGTNGPSGTGGSTGGTIGSGGGGPSGGSNGTGGQTAGNGGQAGGGGQTSGSGGNGGQAGGGATNGGGGSVGPDADGGGQTGGNSGTDGGVIAGSCVGKAVPTADPTKVGPFETTTDKSVGPVAGAPNDPIHGDTPVSFNVYRPKDLTSGGYCFPVVIWSNGHGDQPEPSAPECVLKACGHYATLMQQFASHGFVVVVSMSSQTSQGNPVPSLVGLDWIIKQENDPASPYYHHLDTTHIGAAGHSEGGFTTCGKMASDPRISAISTVSGSSANPAIHQPTLLFCGANDPTVPCSTVVSTFSTITSVPAMLVDNLSVNHLSWSSQGTGGPTISGLIAWFRVQLMGDTGNRKYFYGPGCTFCMDSRVTVMRNSLMTP